VTEGIHVEVAIGDPNICQVAGYSVGTEGTVTGVTKSPAPDETGAVVEEFTRTEDGTDIEPDGGVATEEGPAEKLFEAGGKDVFRFTRETPQHCVCERIEQHGCPVRDVNAIGGTLYATFVAPDHETLQAVLEELTDVYDSTSVCRLLRSEGDKTTERPVFVDFGALTDRQREVLQTAHELGYFEHPRVASSADVAEELDIATSTFTEHLAAAQRNLLDELLSE
jgi:hypothetical protein